LAAVVKMLHANKWAVSTNERQARFVAAPPSGNKLRFLRERKLDDDIS
jgi:hypothetical protein